MKRLTSCTRGRAFGVWWFIDMGNFAALVGCPSKEAAQTENHWSNYWDADLFEKTGWGPAWLSKYCIGGFWLACFSPEDEILIDRDGDQEFALTFIGYFTPVETAIDRLKSRKIGMLNLVPEQLRPSYSDLYDDWIEALSDQFNAGLFLDCDDIFGMIGHKEGSNSLREHVALIAALTPDSADVDIIEFGLTGLIGLGEASEYDAKTKSAEQLAQSWRYAVTADPAVEFEAWPPKPTDAEIEFAKQVILDTLGANKRAKPWWKFW